jgi:hypothetical protein
LDDLDTHTALYADCYVALRILGIRYVEYMRSTTPKERALYQYFLALESLKEQRAHEKIQAESAAKDEAYRAVSPSARA